MVERAREQASQTGTGLRALRPSRARAAYQLGEVTGLADVGVHSASGLVVLETLDACDAGGHAAGEGEEDPDAGGECDPYRKPERVLLGYAASPATMVIA